METFPGPFAAPPDPLFLLLAYKASSYLQEFLKQGAIVPQPSQELDQIYHDYAPIPPEVLASTTCSPPPPPSAESSSSPPTPVESYLHQESIPKTGDVTTKSNFEDLGSDTSSTTPSTPPLPSLEPSHGDHHNHTSEGQRRLILTGEAVPVIMKLFDLKQNTSFAGDVYRALEQARLRILKGQ